MTLDRDIPRVEQCRELGTSYGVKSNIPESSRSPLVSVHLHVESGPTSRTKRKSPEVKRE